MCAALQAPMADINACTGPVQAVNTTCIAANVCTQAGYQGTASRRSNDGIVESGFEFNMHRYVRNQGPISGLAAAKLEDHAGRR